MFWRGGTRMISLPYSVALSFPFQLVYGRFGLVPSGVRQMKKLLILLLSICALVLAQFPARAQGVSFGIPLPFPFLFYNFGPTYYSQPYYGGYYGRPYYGGYYGRPYYARPYYYRRAYYYGGYRPRYYGPGW
jgi:hypothetical protein